MLRECCGFVIRFLPILRCFPFCFANSQGHELKIFISESEEFEIVGLKLHKMKLFKVVSEPPGIALNSRLVISDQLDNNDEVFLITDAATLGVLDKQQARYPSQPQKDCMPENGGSECYF
jgi:hypothetical protein